MMNTETTGLTSDNNAASETELAVLTNAEVSAEYQDEPLHQQTEFVVNLKDFSSFEKSQVENKPFVSYKLVKDLFGSKVTEDNYIHLFCTEVQRLIQNSAAEDILMLNGSVEEDEEKDEHLFAGNTYSSSKNKIQLIRLLGTEHWVQKYTGVLHLTIENEDPSIPKKSLTINIRSRFDQNEQSYFLLYMFAKTMNPHSKIFHNMQVSASPDSIWELLLATAFIRHLHSATKKGMLRQYRNYERNDSRIKGRIDVARHIRQNTPFMGNVAYSSREYVVDNPINILILRTMAHLEKKYGIFIRRVLSGYPLVKQGLTLLKNEIPNWQAASDVAVLRNARSKVANSVYRDYETVRKTAFAIFNQMGVNAFATSTSADTAGSRYSVSGFLIDMPDLWEKFLHASIFQDYMPGDYEQKGYPIIGSDTAKGRIAKPDYLLRDQRIVLDAKYKDSWGQTLENKWGKVRDDTYQILSYALIFDCIYCGVIFPVSMDQVNNLPLQDRGRGRKSKKSLMPDVKARLNQNFKEVEIQQTWCKDRYFVRLPYVIPQIDASILSKRDENSDAVEKTVDPIHAEFEKSAQWIRDRLEELKKAVKAQEKA